jgi:hypothetical protein
LLSTDSRAPRRSSRLAGAAGALLLQGGLLLLFLSSMPAFRPPLAPGRELILRLPRLIHSTPAPAPSQTAPRTQMQTMPLAPSPLPQTGPPIVPVPPDVLPGLKNFGQTLNGCAPESYANLPPDQKARCPRPGAGVAIQELPNLMGSPNPAKDEALWQEQWDEAHWMPALCDPREETVVLCLMHQEIAEYERAEDVRWHLARDKAAALQTPKYPLPKSLSTASSPEEKTHPAR